MKNVYFRGSKLGLAFSKKEKMKIALFGYGKMGKEIEAFALAKGHSIVARVNRENPKENFDLSDTDVIIEFSLPEFAAANIRYAIDLNIPIVVGTTGWYDELDELTAYCAQKKGAFLHATNFSLGVNAFFAVNRYLAKIMNDLSDYSAELREIHHTQKLDAPSGTAISLAEQVIQKHDDYTKWVNDTSTGTANFQLNQSERKGYRERMKLFIHQTLIH